MAKTPSRSRNSALLADGFLFAGGAMSALLIVWGFSAFVNTIPKSDREYTRSVGELTDRSALLWYDPPDPTFYDDPDLSFSVEWPMEDWDERRMEWIKRHPHLVPSEEKVIMLTGSQSLPCRSPYGDHFLLRFFKNKVDYCRIHGIELFYNNVLLHPGMNSFWAKLPVVRAAMMAHPEAEWIWWVDSDAVFTDMEFKLPLKRYRNHNLVVHGWEEMVYQKRSWTSLNAGVFLIRNCQWSMEMMEEWAHMGPQTPRFMEWGRIQKSLLRDKLYPGSDDQAALIYLLLKERQRWADKIYLEGEYYFQGYWMDIVDTLNNTTAMYEEIDRRVKELRRRHAEVSSRGYAALRERYLRTAGYGRGSWRRPFVTHFTGCQPCSGDHNDIYSGDTCWVGMEAALNFADNHVLRSYGFFRRDIRNSTSIYPLPFDFPT